MKKSLKHLPQKKRDELKNIAAIIREKCDDVEMIILFGSYARGNYREPQDVIEKPGLRKVSDYDILVVTGTEKSGRDLSLWSDISDLCETNLWLRNYVSIVAHDIKTLNIKLSEGQYFFSDAKKDGVILYNSKKFKLARKRKLTNEEKAKISQKYFDEWFSTSRDFWKKYQFMFDKGRHKSAAFDLHQAAEHAYKTIIGVFTHYLPKEHFLTNLACRVRKFHPELKTLFPQNNRRERDRFKALEYAYIGARYDPDFMMLKADQEILDQDVKKLIGITKEICEAKITELLR